MSIITINVNSVTDNELTRALARKLYAFRTYTKTESLGNNTLRLPEGYYFYNLEADSDGATTIIELDDLEDTIESISIVVQGWLRTASSSHILNIIGSNDSVIATLTVSTGSISNKYFSFGLCWNPIKSKWHLTHSDIET